MADNEIPVRVVESDEPMPFKWRVAMHDEGRLAVDVGDQFELSPVFETPVVQIGFSLVAQGLNLMGFSAEERQMIAALVLQMGDAR